MIDSEKCVHQIVTRRELDCDHGVPLGDSFLKMTGHNGTFFINVPL